MTPLHFGDSKSPLWGVIHEPPASIERGHGVVLCPPVGHEYERTHWALRQLATHLARAGHHVIRFDWHGVGDSAGNLFDASVERWIEDVLTAAQELRDTAGVQRVSMVGVRFGAAIAALSARKVRPPALVLWDPVTSGNAYIDGLMRIHQAALNDTRRFWSRWPARLQPLMEQITPASIPPGHRAPGELVGARFSEALIENICTVTPERLADLPRTKVFLVQSRPDALADAYAGALSGRGLKVERRTTSASTCWFDHTRVDELFLPADAPAIITSCFDG